MFPYDALWHYSEKFTRDQDLRQDLVLLAWRESMKGERYTDIRLLKNLMKLRAKEIKTRSPLGVDISGKSKMDVWNHGTISMSTVIHPRSGFRIEDTFSTCGSDPLGVCVVNQFYESLQDSERSVADGMIAGYNLREMRSNLGLSDESLSYTRRRVQEKALEYLV